MAGFDYIPVSSNRTFVSGSLNNATRCVDISIIEDSALESNQTFTLTLTVLDASINAGIPEVTTITITDNDSK